MVFRYPVTTCIGVAVALMLLSFCAGACETAMAETISSPHPAVASSPYADPASIALDTTENVLAACKAVYDEYRVSIASRADELAEGQIVIGEIPMQVDMQLIGEPDENGYPLILALHGGGASDTPSMNDSQWAQMQEYYKASVINGIYIAPRGIRDTWDTHFNPESYAFYDRIIEDAIAFENVDPDRVYLLGFSAGGDGVYAIAPRMADRFAAVNMSAGHPNGISIVNLYHLPIFLQVGEKDDAYHRNTVTAQYDALLDQAAATYGGGYLHTTFIHIGMPHNFYDNGFEDQLVAADGKAWFASGSSGTVMADTNAVRLTGAYTREANPVRVVWEVETNALARNVRSFYWLGRNEELDQGTLVARYSSEANRITVESCTAEKGILKVYLTASMVDLFAPVTVDFCGTVSEKIATPSLMVMRATAAERGDPEMVYAAVIEVDVATGAITGMEE
ncbi:MAG: hypothetical protein VB104_04020 [Candidatus Limiplasma sp.]|nr:hypothetical protein [Candidatus Limiplasma sp.]